MNKVIVDRILNEADYMINTEKTIREIAKEFRISKSTVHKDLNERLYSIDKNRHLLVSKILKHHIEVRHIRGGESTRKKYIKKFDY